MKTTAKLNLGLYFIAIAILLVLTALSSDRDLNLHFRDTFLVLPQSYLFKVPALLLVVVAILYLVTWRIARTISLTWIHTLGTLALLAWIIPAIYSAGEALSTAGDGRFINPMQRFRLIWAFVQLLLWWQLLLPLNWILSWIKRNPAGAAGEAGIGTSSLGN